MNKLIVVLALLGAVKGAQAAQAALEVPLPITHLDVTLDIPARRVSGVVTFRFTNPSPDPLPQVYAWLFPNRLARPPEALNDVNFYWVYPRRANGASMRVLRAWEGSAKTAALKARVEPHAISGKDTLLVVELTHPVPPGEHVDLSLEYEMTIPERHGVLGCIERTCTLLGGYYPMLAEIDAAGWNLSTAPARVRFSGTLALTTPAHVVALGQYSRRTTRVHAVGEGTHFPLLVAPRLYEQRRKHRGVTLVYLGLGPPPPADDASSQILAYTAEDYGAIALAAAARAIDLLADVGVPVASGERVTMVEAPLRLDLALAEPGMTVVSDRLYRIFPIRRGRKFHERELIKAVYTELLARRFQDENRGSESVLAAEASASYLCDLYTIKTWHKSEFARDLLTPVSFVPAVDQILYSPQVPFSDAYFGKVEDDDLFRDQVSRFAHLRPRGHVIYEKLRDLLGAERAARVMLRVLSLELSLGKAAEAEHGGPLDWFFAQWERPHGRVNYRLGARSKARSDERREGGKWLHRIVVEKLPLPGEEVQLEPVEVRVVDGNGKRQDLVWDGVGDRGVVEVVSESEELTSVEIDPRHRLVESELAYSAADPRFDNRSPPRLKFIYNSFGALLNLSDLTASLLFDFEFGRIHDTQNKFRLQLYRTDAVPGGGSVSYSRPFGSKVTQSRLTRAWTIALGVARLDADFGRAEGEPSRAGTRVSLGTGVGADDRLFVFEPRWARGFSLGGRLTLTHLDEDGSVRKTGSLFADYTRIVTPWDRHTLVGNVEGAVVGGDIVTPSQLLGGGGPDRLRGYHANRLFGRARVTAHAEWRLSLRHDLNHNYGHWLWLRGVGAAFFVDGGALSGCDAYGDLLGRENLFASLGLGLRFFYDNFGVQQGMMALDFAVPLVDRMRSCLDRKPASTVGKVPFTLQLTFLPPF
ncbi:MAG: hypothetical protein HY698_01880 [Deltaproteobacteria bacterium]|nr:hypothetical protein [Deltaproteobacteria bacterium]